MRILLTALVVSIAAAITMTSVVRADNGPHSGQFSTTTDACAGCHRVHRGQSGGLLMTASQQDLCYSCHGASVSGADTNVVDGIYLARASGGIYGAVGMGLRGGGFVNAWMDTDYTDGNDIGISRGTTSAHDLGTPSTIWGKGAIGSGVGESGVTLECSNCHNPHGGAGAGGSATYRILRPIPIGSGESVGIDVTDASEKRYTLTDTTLKSGNQYFGELYNDVPAGQELPRQLSNWCAKCHTRYMATWGSGHGGGSGDAIFAFRHVADGAPLECQNCHPMGGAGPFVPRWKWGLFSQGEHYFDLPPACLTCHVAHGSAASMTEDGMTTYSEGVEWPGSEVSVVPGQNSRLLRLDNRGICVQCHLP